MASATILVVEDDPLSRELIVDLLEAAGYTVLQTEDGLGLLERVQAEQPDLILLDLQLPGVDGLTLARQLTAHPETRQIPILAMSAHASPERRAQVMAAGCLDFLAKPLDTRAVLSTVARFLGGEGGLPSKEERWR
jgi:CheY-like chemotaxis protein